MYCIDIPHIHIRICMVYLYTYMLCIYIYIYVYTHAYIYIFIYISTYMMYSVFFFSKNATEEHGSRCLETCSVPKFL